MSEERTERVIEHHLKTHRPYLVSAASRAFYTAKSYGYDADGIRDKMIDRVESYLFNDLEWEQIPATVISDIAHEIADEVLASR